MVALGFSMIGREREREKKKRGGEEAVQREKERDKLD